MLEIDECLARAMAIPGARSVTMVDHTSGLAIAAAGGDDRFDRDEDAAATTEIVRSVLTSPVMAADGADHDIDDVIVSGASGYHLLSLINTAFNGQLFLHLRIDRDRGNLALARLGLQGLVREMAEK